MSNSPKAKSGHEKGTLYLIPVGLGADDLSQSLPSANTALVNTLQEFIVENARTARRSLRAMGYTGNFDDAVFHILDKQTPPENIPSFLTNALKGINIGLLSEAGSPCIADPGQLVVKYAHENQVRVAPLVGPSSILLALIASGFNGQSFAFHGYLPIEKKDRVQRIRELENEVYRRNQTQIFMETPYRNNALVEDIISSCKSSTLLCIASALTTKDEFIKTLPAGSWKKQLPQLHKKPTVFLLYK